METTLQILDRFSQEKVTAAGYTDDFSKSNNAWNAEAEGRFPASKLADKLGVPVKFITKHAPSSGEWHHTSKFYNATPYYDHDEVREWLESEEGKSALDGWKKEQAEVQNQGHKVMENASIKYLEWGGTRNHPIAHEIEEHGVHIHQKPGQEMVTVTRPDGTQFKKKLTTRGFEIKNKSGEHFYADYVFKNESVPGGPHPGKGNWGHGGPGQPGGPGSGEQKRHGS